MITWLKTNGVESVAMESTGVYWIVSYEMLEQAGFDVYKASAEEMGMQICFSYKTLAYSLGSSYTIYQK